MPIHNYPKVKDCRVLDISYDEALLNFHPLWKSEYDEFGIEIVKARIRSGLTQYEVAKRAGIDPATLRRWENSEKLPREWKGEKLNRFRSVLDLNSLRDL